MDQKKIGRFIAEKRKEKNLTQVQLAERLGITDRAVSKWETGKSLPDASLMLALCELLGVTVNDLLNGEVVFMENYGKITEKNLIEMIGKKEEADRRLLVLEIVIGILSSISMITMLAVAAWLMETGTQRLIPGLLIGIGLLQFLIAMLFGLRIEQIAGYYECEKCGHRYVPSYRSVNFAMHLGRTRYMKCPECGKRSWQKKVIGKE